MLQPDVELSPDRLIELGTAYWASRTLLSAVELDVFTVLADGPLPADDLRERLGLHDRAAADFLDALVALRLLHRDDDTYRNTPETDLYLDSAKATYLGGNMAFNGRTVFGRWASLTDALRTGINPTRTANADFFAQSYADPQTLTTFLYAMSALSAAPATALAERFPWEGRKTFCDLGSALGTVPVTLARRHTHTCAVWGSIFPRSVRCSKNSSPTTNSGPDCRFMPGTSSRTRFHPPRST
jgi:hypothetical protein